MMMLAATPKATMSQSESYSLPKSLSLPVIRAMRPSSASAIIAARTPTAAFSKRPVIAITTP